MLFVSHWVILLSHLQRVEHMIYSIQAIVFVTLMVGLPIGLKKNSLVIPEKVNKKKSDKCFLIA
ncbi:hypothetical protein I8F73_05705 [Enterococcus faecalis]|nr:hypothetical protein [Enterococcus faecalis]